MIKNSSNLIIGRERKSMEDMTAHPARIKAI